MIAVNWFSIRDTSLLSTYFNNTQQTFFIGLQLSTFAGELASKAIVATIQFISHRISSQKPDVVLSAGRTEHVLVHFKHGVDWHKSKEKCKWFLIIFSKEMMQKMYYMLS